MKKAVVIVKQSPNEHYNYYIEPFITARTKKRVYVCRNNTKSVIVSKHWTKVRDKAQYIYRNIMMHLPIAKKKNSIYLPKIVTKISQARKMHFANRLGESNWTSAKTGKEWPRNTLFKPKLEQQKAAKLTTKLN